MTKSKKLKKPTAFNQLRERTILKHVRSVIWILTATHPVPKFVAFYRYKRPQASIAQEVQRRCIQGEQPRTVYITKACRSTDMGEYLANPIELHFSKSKFYTPTKAEFDPTYTVSSYIKDSYKGIPLNAKHLITSLMAFRCSDEPFDDAEMLALFEREGLFTMEARWQNEESRNAGMPSHT